MATGWALRGFLAFTMLTAIVACSSLPPTPRDLADEQTGATVTVVGVPITFVRQLSSQSSHDFLTLVAIEKDDAGKITDLLLLYRWSTFYGPATSAPESSGELLIEADGNSIQLHPLPQLPAGLPKPKDLYVPDTTPAAMHAYAANLETMRQIATSHQLTVVLPQDSLSSPFELLQDGRRALAQFVDHLSGH